MKLRKSTYDETYFSSIVTVLTPKKIRDLELQNKKKLIRSYKTSGSMLDIGCGEGLLLTHMQDTFTVRGIDISEYAVKQTNKKLGPNVASCMNIETHQIPSKYDVITAFDVLEHLQNPKKAIQTLVAALRPGGVFIFTVPNNYGLYGKLNTKFANFIDKTHISTFPRNTWIELVNEMHLNYTVEDQVWFDFKKSPLAKHFSVNLTIIIEK